MPSNLLKRGAAGYASVDLSQRAKRDAYALRTPYLADFAAGRTRELVRWPLGIVGFIPGGKVACQQFGSTILKLDFLVFFSDPLETQPHDPDVKALLRLAVVWNVLIACNRTSADFIISSPLMDGQYDRRLPDYRGYRQRATP